MFNFEDTNVTISSSRFIHLSLSTPLLIFNNTNSNSATFLKIDHTLIFDIVGNNSCHLFQIEGEKNLIRFESLQISMVGFFLNVINIFNQNGNFSINSSIFFQNYPTKNVLALNRLILVNITNTVFQSTNIINREPFMQGGGNILIWDCFIKSIENLEISYSFSSTTTFGIKITDPDQKRMTENAYVIK